MKTKPKKVCMVVYTEYDTDTRVRREAETLAELPGFKVTVLALKRHLRPRKYSMNGVELIELNEMKYYGNNKLKYIFSYIKFVYLSMIKCAGLLFSRNLDVVHIHNMPNFLVFSALVPKLLRRKVILDLHDSVPETYAAKFRNGSSTLFSTLCLEESIACCFADRLICVNHVQRDALVKRGISEHKITISMNVPDSKIFESKKILRTDKENKKDKFKVVYHGTMAERLGIDLIIRAIHKLIGRIPGIEFYTWGRGGGDLNNFLRIAKELGIRDKVKNHDALPIDSLIPKLMEMDIGVIGNRKNVATELMLPVKMLEYVALGIPVVAPRLKAIQYYFTEDMVSYYEPENVDSMAEAILRLYENPSLRKEQAKRAKAFLDKYGWDKHKYDLINLYKQL